MKNKFIDPKNSHTVGTSWLNLGNHVLVAGFIACILFVVYTCHDMHCMVIQSFHCIL